MKKDRKANKCKRQNMKERNREKNDKVPDNKRSHLRICATKDLRKK